MKGKILFLVRAVVADPADQTIVTVTYLNSVRFGSLADISGV